eukprot:186808-Chlamydomonas_euryale.AAC.2
MRRDTLPRPACISLRPALAPQPPCHRRQPLAAQSAQTSAASRTARPAVARRPAHRRPHALLRAAPCHVPR